ncbi:hypothetical protein BOX15_Mlig013973g1, partial [Macrostomum lignano]
SCLTAPYPTPRSYSSQCSRNKMRLLPTVLLLAVALFGSCALLADAHPSAGGVHKRWWPVKYYDAGNIEVKRHHNGGQPAWDQPSEPAQVREVAAASGHGHKRWWPQQEAV